MADWLRSGPALSVALATAFIDTPAAAYIGPGAGLGAVGVLIAVIIGVLLLLVGFVWYPLKRLLRGRKQEPASEDADRD